MEFGNQGSFRILYWVDVMIIIVALLLLIIVVGWVIVLFVNAIIVGVVCCIGWRRGLSGGPGWWSLGLGWHVT